MTRADLPAGDQAVQAAHAALEFAAADPGFIHGTLVLLAAPDELALCWLLADAHREGLRAVPFHEPDLGGELTAVGLEPAAARLCRRFPLILQGVTA